MGMAWPSATRLIQRWACWLAGLSKPPRIGVQANVQRNQSGIFGSSISSIHSASSSGSTEMNASP